MPKNSAPPATGSAARRARKSAVVLLLAFVCVSTAFHLLFGSTITTLAPHWRDRILPDQAISIITFSHTERETLAKPTPTPTPPPVTVKRTRMVSAALRYLEMGIAALHHPAARPPARSTLKITVRSPQTPQPVQPPSSRDVTNEPTAKPVARAAANADTGGSSESQLASSIQWGDDNPPRLVKPAPVNVAAAAAQRVRLAVEVGPDGDVLSVKVVESSGDQAFDDAALDAVRRSRFAPATMNGLPVHGSCIVEFPPAQTNST